MRLDQSHAKIWLAVLVFGLFQAGCGPSPKEQAVDAEINRRNEERSLQEGAAVLDQIEKDDAAKKSE